MSELGYHAPVPGIYGTPNPPYPTIGGVGAPIPNDSTPELRAELQERYAAMARERASAPGYIPPSYVRQGGGNLPVIGWTAQNGTGPPFPSFLPPGAALPVYPVIGGISTATEPSIGKIPDWTGDPNPIAGGSYDMNQAVAAYPVNPLNMAPVGELDPLPIDQPNPNFLPQDQGGTIDLEW